jgi:hypothetical protein
MISSAARCMTSGLQRPEHVPWGSAELKVELLQSKLDLGCSELKPRRVETQNVQREV